MADNEKKQEGQRSFEEEFARLVKDVGMQESDAQELYKVFSKMPEDVAIAQLDAIRTQFEQAKAASGVMAESMTPAEAVEKFIEFYKIEEEEASQLREATKAMTPEQVQELLMHLAKQQQGPQPVYLMGHEDRPLEHIDLGVPPGGMMFVFREVGGEKGSSIQAPRGGQVVVGEGGSFNGTIHVTQGVVRTETTPPRDGYEAKPGYINGEIIIEQMGAVKIGENTRVDGMIVIQGEGGVNVRGELGSEVHAPYGKVVVHENGTIKSSYIHAGEVLVENGAKIEYSHSEQFNPLGFDRYTPPGRVGVRQKERPIGFYTGPGEGASKVVVAPTEGEMPHYVVLKAMPTSATVGHDTSGLLAIQKGAEVVGDTYLYLSAPRVLAPDIDMKSPVVWFTREAQLGHVEQGSIWGRNYIDEYMDKVNLPDHARAHLERVRNDVGEMPSNQPSLALVAKSLKDTDVVARYGLLVVHENIEGPKGRIDVTHGLVQAAEITNNAVVTAGEVKAGKIEGGAVIDAQVVHAKLCGECQITAQELYLEQPPSRKANLDGVEVVMVKDQLWQGHDGPSTGRAAGS